MLVEYTLLGTVYEVIYNFSLATPTIWVESSQANYTTGETLDIREMPLQKFC